MRTARRFPTELRSMQRESVTEAAVVREQRQLMDRVEWNFRTLTAMCRLLCA
jgi:hypothetical protein